MLIPAGPLQQAIAIYLRLAYENAPIPPAVQQRAAAIAALPTDAAVSPELLEPMPCGTGAGYALRLGQPLYPHMKLVVEPSPCSDAPGFFFRADAHDRHLHAAPGSPDAAWLASIRASNKALDDKIGAAWADAGLPTFKEFLRQQLAARKNKPCSPPA
jgi:hypothetical protein